MIKYNKSELKYIRHIISTGYLPNYRNWLYHHTQLLSSINVMTGEQAIYEMKQVCKTQIDKSHYAGAMATLRKLHDMLSDYFYDANDYEQVNLKDIKNRILNLKK